MLYPEYIDEMLNSEWVENTKPDEMPERFTGDQYRLKDGAPEDFKKQWDEFIALARQHL